MTDIVWSQIALYCLCLTLCVKPLGWYIARVYQNKPLLIIDTLLQPIERLIYRLAGIQTEQSMRSTKYLSSMLIFNGIGILVLYCIQQAQFYLPFNPQHLAAPDSLLAFNTAVSFVTNTDWQSYAGETTMSYGTQMLGLTAQNFISAATGMSILVALIRGIAAKESDQLGNFWVDTVRGVLYILLPLSLLLAGFLVSQGSVQTLQPNQQIHVLGNLEQNHQQIIPMGPVATQTAIEQLGSNGGGFFNANTAHPFQNPTPLTNFIQIIALLLIPSALCYTYGVMVKDKRQGWSLFAAMLGVFVIFLLLGQMTEEQGNQAINRLYRSHDMPTPHNLEGKEVRFGVFGSVLWSTAATATSGGSCNAALDSYTPLGGLVPLWMMQLGEVIFGGVGCGLYGILMLLIITVFIAGLMVGRTPEYLGKKIEPFEMKMASLAILITPILILLGAAIATLSSQGLHDIEQYGPHAFTERLYAFTSLAMNNGSAFAGLDISSTLYNVLGALVMLIGRYGSAAIVLAIAGSLANKKINTSTAGTLPTSSTLFLILLVGIIVLVGALCFVPALSLGPIAEYLIGGANHVG